MSAWDGEIKDLIEWFELAASAEPPELPELPFALNPYMKLTSYKSIKEEIAAGPAGLWARNGDLLKHLAVIKTAMDQQ